jgi:hypothetical protein
MIRLKVLSATVRDKVIRRSNIQGSGSTGMRTDVICDHRRVVEVDHEAGKTAVDRHRRQGSGLGVAALCCALHGTKRALNHGLQSVRSPSWTCEAATILANVGMDARDFDGLHSVGSAGSDDDT